MTHSEETFRNTTQHLMPGTRPVSSPGGYDIYPVHPVNPGNEIDIGFRSLARRIAGFSRIALDGFVGVLWEDFRRDLDDALRKEGIVAHWFSTESMLKDEARIEELLAQYLGGDDPIFGTRYPGTLRDFFDSVEPDLSAVANGADTLIVYGCGAALAAADAAVIYVDLPKNELQFRARAGVVRNLGARRAGTAREQYKRFYFVDWVVLNRHRREILNRIEVIVDGQRPNEPAWMDGAAFRQELDRLSRTSFRARPWFEPGVWGGHWIEEHIPALARDVPNYAWSFELISPENGLVFESNDRMLEVSFDFLMLHRSVDVLGDYAAFFGDEFPIRFDFLDTVGGGNLSLQCHPQPDFIRQHFGERFTQDETYFILDCEPGAEVYLGFQEGIDRDEFREALEESFRNASEVDVKKFVRSFPAEKHDLFLIPNGTIHCSGAGNLVLEISATPYIFTFKMYDWMRLDLDGKPRPLNIDRAFSNLIFERQGRAVEDELLSKPAVFHDTDAATGIHQPTHHQHFYDVHRWIIREFADIETAGSPHVLSLVEGENVILVTPDGTRRRFNYAETFVVPAAAGRYRLISEQSMEIQVVVAFMKPGREELYPPRID